MIVLTLVREFRADMPLLGTRKLFHLLTPELEKHGIKMGRDQLFELLCFHGLLIRRRRRKTVKTTDSNGATLMDFPPKRSGWLWTIMARTNRQHCTKRSSQRKPKEFGIGLDLFIPPSTAVG